MLDTTYYRPRVLWLESGDLYTIRRGIEVGPACGIDVEHLEITDLTFIAEPSGSHIAGPAGDILTRYDAVVVRSFMPWISEALTIARLFSEAGKVVVDASLVDEGYAMSKMHDYMVLQNAGIAVPLTYQCFDPWEAEKAAMSVGFPCVLKGIHGAEGRHVYKADNHDQFRRLISKYKMGELLVQEFLPAEYDYRVIAVGYTSLPVIVRRRPRPGEFRTNFDHQEEVTPLSAAEHPEIAKLGELAARVLRREFSGVDIRKRGAAPVVLEANRRPGFLGFEEKTHYDVAGAFMAYVAHRLRVHRGEKNTGV